MDWLLSASRAQQIRSVRQFVEDELTIPTGPKIGLRYRVDYQPIQRHYFDAVDDETRYREIVATGPSQSGKSLACFVVPILYHLFERREDVIAAVTEKDMAKDKWLMDLVPVIERTRYREWLPRGGAGSRGGTPDLMQFGCGSRLKWMSGGGSDKERAYFTCRVVVGTEVDGLDVRGSTSKEARKITQIEQRTKAFWSRRRIYKECTVTDEEGHIWQSYQRGTRSEIVVPCPKCRCLVNPGRDCLIGWRDATTDAEAVAMSSWSCPECGKGWTELERAEAVARCQIVHRGQEIAGNQIVGTPTPTLTFSLRWTAFHNLFAKAGDVGCEEWQALSAVDEDDAQRALHQFTWAMPYTSPHLDRKKLDFKHVMARTGDEGRRYGKGIVPDGARHLTMGIDVGKRKLHWTAIAQCREWKQIVDYGEWSVRSDDIGLEMALLEALEQLAAEVADPGFATVSGGSMAVQQVWIDSRWQSEQEDESRPVFDFILSRDTDIFRPIRGRGVSKFKSGSYHHPTQLTQVIRHIGRSYYLKFVPDHRLYVAEANVDYWKSQLHDALRMNQGETGSMSIWHSTNRYEHIQFAKHLTAEHPVEEFVPGKGRVISWEQHRESNHFLDSTVYAMVAGEFCFDTEEPTDDESAG